MEQQLFSILNTIGEKCVSNILKAAGKVNVDPTQGVGSWQNAERGIKRNGRSGERGIP